MQEKTRQNLAKIVIIFLGFLIPGFIFFGLLQGPIYSASSDTINLQGKIVRNDAGHEGLNITAGSPACVVSGDGNDTCDFRVRYYDAPTAGNLLLTEQFNNVEIGQYVGVFNVSLGSDPAPLAGTYTSLSGLIQGEDDVYVEVGFDPAGASTYTEVFSRMPLEASGYAIRAKYADSATGATEMSWSGLKNPTGDLSLQHSTYTTLFNWATGTGTDDLFSLTSDASSNGTGALMNIQTGTGSTLTPFRVRAGATEAIYVNNSGNVGVGTVSPETLLTIQSSATESTSGQDVLRLKAKVSWNTPGSGPRLRFDSQTEDITFGAIRGIPFGIQKTGLAFETGYNGPTIKMVIDNSGNLGIGTTFPTGAPADKLTVAGGNTTIYNPAFLGSEKVTNGAFADSSVWTWGTGWVHDATNLEADHTAGNIIALEQNVSAIAGEIYQVVFTVKNRTVGSVTPQVGGVNGAAVSSNTTSTQQIRGTGTGNLKFIPTSDFDGSIDDVSVKLITGGDIKLAGLLTGGGTSGIKVLANGNVGIGTMNPGDKLELSNTGAIRFNSDNVSSKAIKFYDTGTETAFIQTAFSGTGSTENDLIFGSDQSAHTLVLERGGNVGIGTTSPTSLLSVGSTSQFQVNSSGDIVKLKNLTYSWPSSHTADGFLKNDGTGNLTWTSITGAGGVAGTGVAGQATFWTGTSTVSGDNAFWWDNTNKRLGIGTTTPSTQLHTTGGVRLAGITTSTETTAVMSDVNGNLSKRVLGSLAFNNSLSFLNLSDVTETTYTGSGGQLVAVNTTETGLEFVTSVPASSVPFSGITSGTNTTAAMVVGDGASLNYTGIGTINASSLLSGTWAVPGAIGSTTANTGAFTTLGASTSLTTPLIQGRSSAPYELTLKSTTNAYNAIRIVNATDTEIMSFDTINSRVGIGTTAPSTQLHTTGGVRLAGITGSTESTAVMADTSGNLSIRGLGLLAFQDSVPGDNWGTQVVQTNTTLTGDGTFTTPLGINLANVNTWTASQTFSASTYFPGSGIWDSSGNVGIGTQTPGTSKLYVSGSSTSLVNLGDTLYVDSTNKRVSVGGGTPAVRFHIQETVGGINQAYITNVGTTNAENQLWFGTGYGGANEKWSGIGQVHSDGSLRFTAGGSLSTPQVTLLPNGNFGIGVVDPSSKLTVYGSSTATTIGGFEVGMRIANTDTTTNNWQSIVFGDTAKAGIEVKNVDHTNDYGDIAFTTRAPDGWLPRMYIQSGGYVGIGNSAPASLFSVGSSSQFQVDTSGDITKIKNLSYMWPTAHTANGYLKNNGAGGLSWAEVNAVQATGTPYGSATAGPLAFWTGTSTIGAPTPYGLYWDDVNQYLGIGTNTPSAPLDIGGGTGGSLIKNSSGDITIEPAANLIISQGDVGIGTATPLAKLHVKGNQILLKNEADADVGLVLNSGSTTTYRDVIYFKDRGTDIFGLEKTSTNAFQLYDYAGTGVSRILVEAGTNSGISFRSKGTGDFSFITDTTTRVTIKSDGKVGIGTASPGATLDVAKAVAATSDVIGSRVSLTQSASGALTAFGNRIMVTASHTSGSLTGIQANSTQLYFTGSGGTTSYAEGVTSNAAVSTGAIVSNLSLMKIFSPTNSGTITNLKGLHISNMNAGSSSNYSIYSEGGTMYHAGYVGIGTPSPGANLDIVSTTAWATLKMKGSAGYPWTISTAWNNTNSDLTFSMNGSEKLRFDANGNVGIGTTSPGKKLDVSGDIRASGETIGTLGSGSGQFRAIGGNYGFMLRNDGGGSYFLFTNSGDQYGSWNSLRPLTIINADGGVLMGNNALYVAHGGDVSIGHYAVASPKLTIDGSNAFPGIRLRLTGYTGWHLFWNASTSNQYDFNWEYNGTTQYHFSQTGQGYANTGWYTFSPYLSYNYVDQGKTKSDYQLGEVVSLESDSRWTVVPSSAENQASLYGVVVLPEGFVSIPKELEGEVDDEKPVEKRTDVIPIAHLGEASTIVFTKTNEIIKPSDPLTSSFITGVGKKATKAGTVLGKALESTKHWNEQNCPIVSSFETISWPEDDGTNLHKPCFRVPVSSFNQEIKNQLMSQYELSTSDFIYVGKIMIFVNVSWYDPKPGELLSRVEEIEDQLDGLGMETNPIYSILSLDNSSKILTIDSSFVPTTNNTYDLGTTKNRWENIYAQGTINLGNATDNGGIRFNPDTKKLEFSNDGTNWIPFGSSTYTDLLAVQYPGSVVLDGTENNIGDITTNNTGIENSSMNYYQWNSLENTLNYKEISIRYQLPSNFREWGSGGITLSFATESTDSLENKVDLYVYEQNSTSYDVMLENNISSVAGQWQTIQIDGSQLNMCNKAEDICIMKIKMSSSLDNYVRVGDIKVEYERTL